eukprot:TRINITY_DN1513_c0_g2_i1.p2 TRINITY_DN1513_c0_g2~~TRINITY_DN1513_c0_g2_i1.p2  ORF type:complete len:141 (-),score=25.09 TRINITY_DN1513_c0_g2_i1:326-748(-)
MSEMEVSSIIKNYSCQINELLIKNEGLAARVDALNKQTLDFQEKSIKLADENKKLRIELGKAQAALEVFKGKAKQPEAPLDLQQKQFLDKRSDASSALSSKVCPLLTIVDGVVSSRRREDSGALGNTAAAQRTRKHLQTC